MRICPPNVHCSLCEVIDEMARDIVVADTVTVYGSSPWPLPDTAWPDMWWTGAPGMLLEELLDESTLDYVAKMKAKKEKREQAS